eukprot:2650155-Pleurochrysis_carterae.AAC.1
MFRARLRGYISVSARDKARSCSPFSDAHSCLHGNLSKLCFKTSLYLVTLNVTGVHIEMVPDMLQDLFAMRFRKRLAVKARDGGWMMNGGERGSVGECQSVMQRMLDARGSRRGGALPPRCE